VFVARFVAAAFGMVAERATLLCNKLHSKVAQQKSGVSSALVTLMLHLISTVLLFLSLTHVSSTTTSVQTFYL